MSLPAGVSTEIMEIVEEAAEITGADRRTLENVAFRSAAAVREAEKKEAREMLRRMGVIA